MKTTLGLMSGTSMDGIDGALLRTDGHHHVEEIADLFLSYEKPFHHALKAAEYVVRRHKGDLKAAHDHYVEGAAAYGEDILGLSPEASQDIFRSISAYFGGIFPSLLQVIQHSEDLHGQVVQDLLQKASLTPRDVDVVGYHGQTLYHAPQEGITLQVGNGLRLATHVQIPVVYDFRTRDVQKGGQGAPFAPLYHQALSLRDQKTPLAIVNCGGISNVTFIFGPHETDLMGFDTGPGNGLIDLYIKRKTQGEKTYDQDGLYGLRGRLNAPLLETLFTSLAPFLKKAPPKSLDIADFSLPSLAEDLPLEDVAHTLEVFTAETILKSLDLIPTGHVAPPLWVLAGGGWKNPVIRKTFEEGLLEKTGARAVPAESMGWNGQALEAQIFAYLAVRSLKGLPLSFPLTTGVPTPTVGGIYVTPIP